MLGAAPILRPLLGRGSPARDWWIFVGVYGGFSVGIAILRSLLAPWATGLPLSSEILRPLTASMIGTLGFSVAALEALVSRKAFLDAWQAELARLRQELAESRSRLVRTDDALRREAAEYLHGEVQSRLLMAWAFLDQARNSPDARQGLIESAKAQLCTLRDESLTHARLLMGLTDRPLTERVSELFERYQTVLPLALSIHPDVNALERHLSPELRSAANDMIEEGLLNAFRHSAAKRVELRLAVSQPHTLTVEIQDDGVGFTPQAQSRGLGLSGLGDTLQAHGGTWRLDSAPGQGTRLTLSLPVTSRRVLETA